MMVGSMAQRGIRVAAAPGQDGGTVDDEVASADEPLAPRKAYYGHKKRFGHGCPRSRRPFQLLRRTGHAWLALGIVWQSAGVCQRGLTDQPIVQVLIGELPQRAQQREEQKGLFAILAGGDHLDRQEVAAGSVHGPSGPRVETELTDAGDEPP